VAQWGPTFLDALVGVRWQNVTINSLGTSGSQDFFLPYGGFQIDHATDIDNLNAQLTVAANVPGVAGTTTSGLTTLQRVAPDKDFVLVNYSAQYSTFLEPLLNHDAWAHDSDHAGTLANELVFLVHGQYSNGRLVPHMQDIAGGFYTVRGYDESLVAGDSSVIATAEYRLHIPRTFDPVDPSKTPLFGRPFRFAPQNVYGTADWDLIFRAFTDVGYVTDNDPIAGIEGSSTLVGSGVGLEFIYKQNLSVRVDWAAALTDVSSGGVTLAPAGSNRFHIAVTLYY
jgi:hemolysin activation/secretion protein